MHRVVLPLKSVCVNLEFPIAATKMKVNGVNAAIKAPVPIFFSMVGVYSCRNGKMPRLMKGMRIKMTAMFSDHTKLLLKVQEPLSFL